MTARNIFKTELIEYLQTEIISDVSRSLPKFDNVTIDDNLLFYAPASFRLTTAGHSIMNLFFSCSTVNITNIAISRAIIDIDRHATGPYYILKKHSRAATNHTVSVYGSEEMLYTALSEDIHFWLAQNT